MDRAGVDTAHSSRGRPTQAAAFVRWSKLTHSARMPAWRRCARSEESRRSGLSRDRHQRPVPRPRGHCRVNHPCTMATSVIHATYSSRSAAAHPSPVFARSSEASSSTGTPPPVTNTPATAGEEWGVSRETSIPGPAPAKQPLVRAADRLPTPRPCPPISRGWVAPAIHSARPSRPPQHPSPVRTSVRRVTDHWHVAALRCTDHRARRVSRETFARAWHLPQPSVPPPTRRSHTPTSTAAAPVLRATCGAAAADPQRCPGTAEPHGCPSTTDHRAIATHR